MVKQLKPTGGGGEGVVLMCGIGILPHSHNKTYILVSVARSDGKNQAQWHQTVLWLHRGNEGEGTRNNTTNQTGPWQPLLYGTISRHKGLIYLILNFLGVWTLCRNIPSNREFQCSFYKLPPFCFYQEGSNGGQYLLCKSLSFTMTWAITQRLNIVWWPLLAKSYKHQYNVISTLLMHVGA